MRPFLALRDQGATFPAIARAIQAATGDDVSPTSVRRWVKAIENGAAVYDVERFMEQSDEAQQHARRTKA